ncbi:DUF3108 domain-containing protein [Sulfurimonas sp.]|nr:DUF3108 domain-containing protein [Sulfurimonas sp.]
MKFFVLLILGLSLVNAGGFFSKYHVNVGMFGQVGYADLHVEVDEDKYKAHLDAVIIGVAATLTSNRVERFTSIGRIVNGKYIPDSFVKIKRNDRKSRVQNYTFNHSQKKVHLVEDKEKIVSKTKFDAIKFEMCIEDVNETSRKEKTLDTYVASDSLTAFLNARENSNAKTKEYELLAVGAYNNKNKVTLSFLEGEEKKLAGLNFSKDTKEIYNLHVKPADEDDSIVDLLVAFDSDGYMSEALIGEIFWIGQITASRVKHEVYK